MISSSSCLTDSIKLYVKFMIEKVSGLKVLILDDATTGIISVVQSQSNILAKEVFLFENIASTFSQSASNDTKHLHALYFLRPTNEAISTVIQELKRPHFADYHLFFSSPLSQKQLERLAKADDHQLVQQVYHFYCDVLAVNLDLFSLEIPSVSSLTFPSTLQYSSSEEGLFDRITNGLMSAILCSIRNEFVGIRYPRNSNVCRYIGTQLATRFSQEAPKNLLVEALAANCGNVSPGTGCILLLIDRREDAVTPLLNQWTYQAMVHELIGLTRNTVKLPAVIDAGPDDVNSFVLDCKTDSFFSEHRLSNFGVLGSAVSNYVKSLQTQTTPGASKRLGADMSIEEMKRFVETYPEFRRLSMNVTKHVRLVHELSRKVESDSLLSISLVEQELVCTEKKQEHFKTILNIIRTPTISNKEKLRLALLFTLRYEHDPLLDQLHKELRSVNIDATTLDLILEFGGGKNRISELFQNKSMLQMAKNVVQRSLLQSVDTSNIYTQYRSSLFYLVENLIKGKIKETIYPAISLMSESHPQQIQQLQYIINMKPPELIVFIVGGTTFQESCDMAQIAREHNCKILLGGTTIHNSQSFLEDVSKLRSRAQHSASTPSSSTPNLLPTPYNNIQTSRSPAVTLSSNLYSSVAVKTTPDRATELESKKKFLLEERW